MGRAVKAHGRRTPRAEQAGRVTLPTRRHLGGSPAPPALGSASPVPSLVSPCWRKGRGAGEPLRGTARALPPSARLLLAAPGAPRSSRRAMAGTEPCGAGSAAAQAPRAAAAPAGGGRRRRPRSGFLQRPQIHPAPQGCSLAPVNRGERRPGSHGPHDGSYGLTEVLEKDAVTLLSTLRQTWSRHDVFLRCSEEFSAARTRFPHNV